MKVYVDATTLISLGSVGELGHLVHFDGEIVIPSAVRAEVTTEPARSNLTRFLDERDVPDDGYGEGDLRQAKSVLGETDTNGDVQLVAATLAASDEIAVVSDDRRVRTTCRGLGATVTGTVGVVVRAVVEGLSAEEGVDLVRRIDAHGLHMTGELRERAYKLVEEAAER